MTFAPGVVTGPIRLVSVHGLPGKSLEHFAWGKQSRGTVVWDGPARPDGAGADGAVRAFGYWTSA